MNILVTGSTGFLGTALCRELEARGDRIEKLNSRNCDLTVAGTLDSYNDTPYDMIYHLAAWTQAGDFCLHHPGEQWVVNQQINTHVLSWWQARQPQAKMIAIGTSCAYAPDMELVEENYLVGMPIDSLFTYAMTKRMLYIGLLALHKQYGLNYLCVVPSTLYGPGYHTDGRQMHFIFDLIRKILVAKSGGERAVLWGDGAQRRELVYVDDFVRILMGLAASHSNDLINIGAGEDYSIREFAQKICGHVEYDFPQIAFNRDKYVGARRKLLEIKRLRNSFGDWDPTPLDVGLSRTIDWMRSAGHQSSQAE